MAELIKVNGKIEKIFPSNGKQFTLSEAYKYLECKLVEVIHLADGRIMIVDECAKLSDDWEINLPASELYRQGRLPAHKSQEFFKALEKQGFSFIDAREDTLDAIAGHAIVCKANEF
jgi:hypothetical protein